MLSNAHESLLGRGGRILILDDGGMILDVANNQREIDANKIVGVEQTTGGINRLQSVPLRFPIVDVASSHAKLSLEAHYIAESIISESLIHLKRLRGINYRASEERYLVVGFGPVGAGVAAMLQNAFGPEQVYVWDTDTRKAAVARQVGFNTTQDISSGLKSASCVIGCTGHRSFDSARDNDVRPGTVLVSGSSANFEFDGIAARSRDRFTDLDESPYYQVARADFARMHDDYKTVNNLGHFWLCNAGFPVNFTGDFDPIDVHHIQVTRALMIAGAVQARETKAEPGLRKFAHEFDACISEVFTKMLAGEE
jgi:S-adenosylhomocysteine hydrolase